MTHDIDEAIRLGDRICILNMGRVLEQIATPEHVLSDPANEFVDEFIGGERGLKRLGLMEIGDADLDLDQWSTRTQPCLWRPRRCSGTARRGWECSTGIDSPAGSAARTSTVCRMSLTSICDPSCGPSNAPIRSGLRSIWWFGPIERVAVVVEGGAYRGILDLESIAREITE